MLSLENISWTAPDGKEVLKNVTVKIKKGSLTALTGPNGGGKTTLARIIAGIEKPTSGKIRFNGEDITGLDVTERAKKGISFAFQQPVRFKGITVRSLIETAAGQKLNEEQICDIMRSVGLCAKDYTDREIDSTLSGGEIKRIEIASVLARHTPLSVFDEPEAGIDIWSFANLIDVFKTIHADIKDTLVIISHQERILSIADEIVLVSGGTVTDKGPGPEMMAKLTAAERSGASYGETGGSSNE